MAHAFCGPFQNINGATTVKDLFTRADNVGSHVRFAHASTGSFTQKRNEKGYNAVIRDPNLEAQRCCFAVMLTVILKREITMLLPVVVLRTAIRLKSNSGRTRAMLNRLAQDLDRVCIRTQWHCNKRSCVALSRSTHPALPVLEQKHVDVITSLPAQYAVPAYSRTALVGGCHQQTCFQCCCNLLSSLKWRWSRSAQ